MNRFRPATIVLFVTLIAVHALSPVQSPVQLLAPQHLSAQQSGNRQSGNQQSGNRQWTNPQTQTRQAPNPQANGNRNAVGKRNTAGNPAARMAAAGNRVPAMPFPKPSPQAEAEMERVLITWQDQSRRTKYLTLGFTKWNYDLSGSPDAQIPATKSSGVLKYAAPDKGLYEVTEKLFYAGFDDKNQPQYQPKENELGEKWVSTGQTVVAYDQTAKKCTIFPLAKHLQGQGIINSPLPFVFNLNAADARQRYWMRLINPPREDLVMIEAWPKTQKDRAEYKMVQIALTKETFLPAGLIVYHPNFDTVGSPNRDIYEFRDVKRNQIFAGIQNFMNVFVPEKPPKGWEVEEDKSLMGQAALQGAGFQGTGSQNAGSRNAGSRNAGSRNAGS
ncbi:MAG: TIGR03009 domain-containing protein [Planctomycetota bacterium]